VKPPTMRTSGTEGTPRAAARVAIVGAGFAGLSCARELCLRGYHPVVFEATDRLGVWAAEGKSLMSRDLLDR
jgi:monoamine oxidase